MLSTTSRAPASCATVASASMSPIVSIGLVGVSTHTSLVRPGSMAAATASVSATDAELWSVPQTLATLSKRRCVPP